jgi:heptosyltransferase-2
MPKTLILKLGALGDVVRTTSVLRILEGPVTWATAERSRPLLEGIPQIDRIVTDFSVLQNEQFDLVLSLDEEREACLTATRQQNGGAQLIGAYTSSRGEPTYTLSSAEWFDMGLISKYGKAEADRRKLLNRKSYQEILFAMLGKKFYGEEYCLPPLIPAPAFKKGRVGLEQRAADRWPEKRWSRFGEFERILTENKREFLRFSEKPTLLEFMRDIAEQDAVVTTDSLSMHLALGLQKKTVALFTCTSPWEIHGYGRMEKAVSPALEQHFYSTARSTESGKLIDPAEVFAQLNRLHD